MLHHAAKARVEHTIDAMAPDVAEQLVGKAKAEAEGKVEEIMGGIKAVTAECIRSGDSQSPRRLLRYAHSPTPVMTHRFSVE